MLHLAAAGKAFELQDPFSVQSLSDKHTAGSWRKKKKNKVQPIPNDLVSKISDQFPKTLPWGFF